MHIITSYSVSSFGDCTGLIAPLDGDGEIIGLIVLVGLGDIFGVVVDEGDELILGDGELVLEDGDGEPITLSVGLTPGKFEGLTFGVTIELLLGVVNTPDFVSLVHS